MAPGTSNCDVMGVSFELPSGKSSMNCPFSTFDACYGIAANVGEAVFVPVVITTFQQEAIGKKCPAAAGIHLQG